MEEKKEVSPKIIEIEVSIQFLEYLQRKNMIDDKMYRFCINKFLLKLDIEKDKMNAYFSRNKMYNKRFT